MIREEGTNGDREMSAALFQAGFEVWDVVMQDLLDKKITVDYFRGVVFPGGFSYAGKLCFLQLSRSIQSFLTNFLRSLIYILQALTSLIKKHFRQKA